MTVAIVSAAAACYMTGVAWLVQLVVYPAFARVEGPAFAGYHEAHKRSITYVVAPAMLVELGTAAWLAYDTTTPLTVTGLGLALATWALTFFVAVPDHERLSRGFDPAIARRLVLGHVPRTVAWTAHAVVGCLIVT